MPFESLRQPSAAILAEIDQREAGSNHPQWQSFHLATFNADKALAPIKNDLKGYKINDTNYPTMVTTPDGKQFPCSTNDYD